MLRFDLSQNSYLGHFANLASGDGKVLFTVAFKEFETLEEFLLMLGQECLELGNCLILTGNTRDRDLVQRNWIGF